jgi:uncharacterized protein YbaP (TraB family)
MKRFYCLFSLAIASLLLVTNHAYAQTARPLPASALLYKIEGKGLKKPSYIFGTVHLICGKDLFNAETMKAYFDQTEQVMLELDMDDPAVIKKVAEASMMKDGKTVKELLKPEEYAKLDDVYRAYLGISFDSLAAFKPLISTTALLMSPKILGCTPPQMYDNVLAQSASARKIPVIGLESAEQQMAVIDSQPMEEQLKGLKDVANNPQKSIASFQKLYKLYLAQDSDELYTLVVNEMKEPALSQTKFLDDRNANWIPIIEKNISVTPTFIGVGAAHLGGKNGVVSLLRAKGYTLTPIRF